MKSASPSRSFCPFLGGFWYKTILVIPTQFIELLIEHCKNSETCELLPLRQTVQNRGSRWLNMPDAMKTVIITQTTVIITPHYIHTGKRSRKKLDQIFTTHRGLCVCV